MTQIYLIGSLRNPKIPRIAGSLRDCGFEVFDDWHAAGPEADDCWQAYEQERGRSFDEALLGKHALDVYWFDRNNIEASDIALLVLPAGKSGHLELGFSLGQGRPGFILTEGEPDRYDVMYNFADRVFTDPGTMLKELHGAYRNYTFEGK